jgi:DNA-directed RNA polymerase subunit RPC12/RpoP
METSCPDCRSHALRRRRRSGFSLYLVSLLGQWPYRCEECGTNFLLRKRYLRSKNDKKHSELSSSHLKGVVLTAPVGGVAGGDAINVRHSAAVRDVDSLSL